MLFRSVLRPFIAMGNEGDVEKEFYLNTKVVTPASPNAPAIKVGYDGTAWDLLTPTSILRKRRGKSK